MGDVDTSVTKIWHHHVHTFIPSVHRKLERSNSRYYQRVINGDSIYTCFDLGSEREFRPPTGRKIVQPHRKSRRAMLIEHGPWFLSLEAVLKHRDADRAKLWERRRERKLRRASRTSQSDAVPSAAELPEQQSAEDEEGDDGAAPPECRTGTCMDAQQDTSDSHLGNSSESQSRAGTPELPSSDLVRTIHHEAMVYYDTHDVLSLPAIRPGRRPSNWEEPIAMARSLDGSALLAIAILLEEITKDQIISQTSNI